MSSRLTGFGASASVLHTYHFPLILGKNYGYRVRFRCSTKF